MKIIFEVHAQSVDNEVGVSSGWHDAALCIRGVEQAKAMGKRYAKVNLAAVYASDVQRAYKTAQIGFEGRVVPIVTDRRLRECDYGDMTLQPAALVKAEKAKRIEVAFPNGESYLHVAERVKSFLDELADRHGADDTVLIIGHRATQYALEHWINAVPLEVVVNEPWTWRPGWEYDFS